MTSHALEGLNLQRTATPIRMTSTTHSRKNSLNELTRSVDETVTYPNRLLAQFTSAGTSPYPMNLARLVSANFEPSATGERLFNTAINNLPVYVTPDEDFQLGWDEKYIYRNIGLHQFEYCHLVLGAALTECLPEDYAALVMKLLADKYCNKDMVNVTHRSWQAWIHTTNGLLSNTDFATLTDDMMRLDPFRTISGHVPNLTDALVTPSVFANALHALGQLNASGVGELALVGTNTLGWFAAFAELFLDLNVQISTRTGEVLHSSHNNGKPLFKLIFSDDIDHLDPGVKASSPRTYTINMITQTADASRAQMTFIPFTGRIRFDGLLSKVFGQAFHLIAHQESKALVKSVGGTARLFELIVENPDMLPVKTRPENVQNTASWGRGLIQTLINWFPELRHLQGRLERVQSGNAQDTFKRCNDGAVRFHELCGCDICEQPPHTMRDKPDKLPQGFCLLALMETIVNLGQAMARIIVIPKLYPSRAGILSLYERQVKKLWTARKAAPGTIDRPNILFFNDYNADYSWRLQTVVTVFSGSWPKNDLPPNLIAIHHEGICASMQGLHTGALGTDRRKDSDIIQVSTSGINYKQNGFVRACWGPPEGIESTDFSWEEAKPAHLSKSLFLKAR